MMFSFLMSSLTYFSNKKSGIFKNEIDNLNFLFQNTRRDTHGFWVVQRQNKISDDHYGTYTREGFNEARTIYTIKLLETWKL